MFLRFFYLNNVEKDIGGFPYVVIPSAAVNKKEGPGLPEKGTLLKLQGGLEN